MKNSIKNSGSHTHFSNSRNMRNYRLIQVLLVLILLSNNLIAQVGIGTTTPQAFFNVAGDKDVLFGDYITDGGKKLIWYGAKASFCAGTMNGNYWDPGNLGTNSFSFGSNAIATGANAISMGSQSTATSESAIALGYKSAALGKYSVAFGHSSHAYGHFSFVAGSSKADGDYASALGFNSRASGDYSIALGHNVDTNFRKGSFAFGDATQLVNNDLLTNDMDHQMVMRFQNGYKLFTNYQATIGVALPHGANAWSVTSDSTRKENFMIADGVTFLQKISKMRLGSWNYKGQDVKKFRHYGPMAQDFYAAFGKDSLGTIGEDKSINQADFDGVNLIAIQALIKEVNDLKAQLAASKDRESAMNSRLDKIENMLNQNSGKATATIAR